MNNMNSIQFIDLGLPSGTLWADRNLGADRAEDFGDYFRFGETSRFDENSNDYVLKDFIMDYDKNIAGTVYDAATIDLDTNYQIPNKLQIKELLELCLWGIDTIGGIRVCEVTGLNGNTLYIPLAGYKHSDEINVHLQDVYDINSYGHYWSSEYTFSGYASCFFFNTDFMNITLGKCSYGLSIRPVKSNIEKALVNKDCGVINAIEELVTTLNYFIEVTINCHIKDYRGLYRQYIAWKDRLFKIADLISHDVKCTLIKYSDIRVDTETLKKYVDEYKSGFGVAFICDEVVKQKDTINSLRTFSLSRTFLRQKK